MTARTLMLRVNPDGRVCSPYTEAVDLAALGRCRIRRAGRVEPDAAGRWWADMAPVGGPKLGPFSHRSRALLAEVRWLESHPEVLAPVPPVIHGVVGPGKVVMMLDEA